MLRVAVISDIFKNSGLGNYCRSRELFFFLKKKKLKTDFFLYKKFLSNKNFYNVIIIDLPLKSYNLEIISKYPDSLVLSLDHNQKYKVDANIAIFKKSPYATKNFVNLKYSIIRRELQNYKSSFNKDLLFISIGSSDIKNKRIYLKKKYSQYFKRVFLSEIISRKIFRNFQSQKNFIFNMKNCILGISNGGTTLLELIYFKKVVIVYPQNTSEKKFSSFLKRRGFKIFINPKKIDHNFFQKILNYKQKQHSIDNKGVYRIWNIINKLYNEKLS